MVENPKGAASWCLSCGWAELGRPCPGWAGISVRERLVQDVGGVGGERDGQELRVWSAWVLGGWAPVVVVRLHVCPGGWWWTVGRMGQTCGGRSIVSSEVCKCAVFVVSAQV